MKGKSRGRQVSGGKCRGNLQVEIWMMGQCFYKPRNTGVCQQTVRSWGQGVGQTLHHGSQRGPTLLLLDLRFLASRTEHWKYSRLRYFAMATLGDPSRSHMQGSAVWGQGFRTGEEKDGDPALKVSYRDMEK